MSDLRSPWVLVSAGFHQRGGQDKANAALARYLLERGHYVTLVCQKADEEFSASPTCHVVTVPRLLNSDFLSHFRLAFAGKRVARRIKHRDRTARVVVNGGIFSWPDLNWVHCVHHAWDHQSPCRHQKVKERLIHALFRGVAKRRERTAIRAAGCVIANSGRTKLDIQNFLGVDGSKVFAVPLGADSQMKPPTEVERAAARDFYRLGSDAPGVVFVGALDRDDHKGFGCVFAAWKKLTANKAWKGTLLVAGAGNQLSFWRESIRLAQMSDQVRVLGFVEDIPRLLAAADLLVSPVRYEAFGLNVQEALCRGVPTFVSGVAGAAERYPADLRSFLLPAPVDPCDLAERILQWSHEADRWRRAFAQFSTGLRECTWARMAQEMVSIAEKNLPVPLE